MYLPGSAFHNSVSTGNRKNCSKQTFHIKKQGLPSALPQPSHIFPIQLRLFRYFQFIPAIDLRPSGQARCHAVCGILVTLLYQILLIPQCRPGADYTHPSPEDIPDLGKLIQAGLSKHAPHPCDILFRVAQLVRRHIVGRIYLHAAVFMQHKKMLILPHSLLCEKDRPWIVQIDCKAEQPVERRQNHQPAEAEQLIHHWLHLSLVNRLQSILGFARLYIRISGVNILRFCPLLCRSIHHAVRPCQNSPCQYEISAI